MSLVAVSLDGPVGVDLEPESAVPPAGITMHARDVGSPLETWVRKEAVLKALGVGLRLEPSSFWIDGAGHTQGLEVSFVVRHLEIEGHVAAVAELRQP